MYGRRGFEGEEEEVGVDGTEAWLIVVQMDGGDGQGTTPEAN